jgi:hypothetical protein
VPQNIRTKFSVRRGARLLLMGYGFRSGCYESAWVSAQAHTTTHTSPKAK